MDELAGLSGVAHVWTLDPDRPDVAARARYGASLSDDELIRRRRYLRARDRDLFLVSHGFLREVLSRYVGLAPRDWRFDVAAFGKPSVANREGRRIQFNLSHTAGRSAGGGLVGVVVTADVPCGIDVERLDSVSDPLVVATTAMSVYERADLVSRPDPRRRFCEYWTLKEAYLKARGAGMRLPLDRFGFVFDPHPRLRVEPPIVDDPGSWQFVVHQPADHLQLAVAVRGHDRPVTVSFH